MRWSKVCWVHAIGVVTSIAGAAPNATAPVDPGAARQAGAARPAERRWTDETLDRMVDDAEARALAPSASEADVVAAALTVHALADYALYGHAERAILEIAKALDKTPELSGELMLLTRTLAADEGTDAGTAIDSRLGVVTNLALLGPFRDTGGGLVAREGPEDKGGSFSDRSARYSWGTVDVSWRAVPAAFGGARGVPLGLFIHPRKESCTLVASRIQTAKSALVVRLAASGSARLMFDGVELGKSEDVHTSAKLDRIAAKVDASAGAHLIAAKVCSGALDDDGRVRLRLTDLSGAPISVVSSGDLRELPDTANQSTPQARAAVSAEARTTALTRTLAGGAAGRPVDGQLAAVVARTLGGADDLKSPRAPGLLDVVTRRAELDPDRLAMAGWVAPSGANRSGWLNTARARAETAGDARTRAFTDRRLMAEHLNAHLADWAMAAARGAKLSTADFEGLLLFASIQDGLGTDALRTAAMRDLARVADANPTTVPNALLEELGVLAAAYDPARRLATYELLARRGEAGLERVQALAVKGRAAVADASSRAFGGEIEDADEGIEVAREASRAGAHDVARALFAKLTEWAPNRAESWAGLADEIAATRSPQDTGGPEMALVRARQLAPGDARYRAELALRQSGNAQQAAGDDHEDERYLVPSQTILAHRQGVAPDVADRELYWLRAVVLHADRRVSQLIHYAREIVIAPRTQDELVEDLPAEGDLTEILRARVHRKDGGTAFPTEEHNEGTRPRIRWPELLPGDTVEVAVRTWTGRAVGGRGDPPFYFLDYAGAPTTHPLLYNEVVVEAPKEHPIYLDVLHGKADRHEERDENGRHITRLVWDRPLLFADEPLTPALSEVVPVTVGSTFKDWSDFRAWYTEAIRDFSTPDDEVKRLALELTRGKVTREEKLRALFDFVADDIRYVNYVSGEWWLPNRPQQLLARREGDCDDKAILLITLLRSVGIEAQEVMVQTRETGQPSVVLAKKTAIPMFDHGIAFLPGPNGGTYLDATSPQSRLGPLPSMDARAVALKIDAGPAEIVLLPASSPEDHGSDVTWTITLHPDGSGDLEGEEKHVGDGAFWLRTYLTQADARAQYVEDNLVAGWFPTVQVDKKIEFKGDLPHGEAWVRYRAHSDGLARHEQSDLVVPLSQSATLASQLAPLLERTLPVSLPSHLAPSHQTRTIRVIAPPGFRWGELPPGGDENGGDFGRAHLDVSRDPRDARALLIKRSVVFNLHVIPIDRYPAWRAWLQHVDALMHKGVRLVAEGSKK